MIFLSAAMTMGQITILGKQVFDMTGNELDLGLLGLVEFLPTALLAPVSGMISDRFDRRKDIRGRSLRGSGGIVRLVLVCGVGAGLRGACVRFGGDLRRGPRLPFTAASRAMPVDLAPEGAVERVVARSSASWQAGIIVGPIMFAFVFLLHPAAPYLLASGVALLAAGLLAAVPGIRIDRTAAAPDAAAAVRRAFEGVRFIRGNRILLGAVSLDLFAVLFGGAVALLPAIAEERLGVDAVGLGVLRAATGVGALIVASALAVRPLERRVGNMLMLAVGVFGVATVVLGFTRQFVVAVVALLVLSGADAVSVYIRATIVPLATPEDMRGRVLAVEYVFIGGSNELGAFESGLAGRFLGVAGAVVTGGLGTLAVVALWWRLFPELRSVDRFADVRPRRSAH